MLRVGKYDWKTKTQAQTCGYTPLLIHTTGSLSPYIMKTKEGQIMENVWQFSKIWAEVPAVKERVSRFSDETRWEHPAEVHWDPVLRKPTPAYWAWRAKGMSHHRWVRYPCGFKHHPEAMGSIVGTPDSWVLIGYLEARRKIYYPVYREIAATTRTFKALHKRLFAKGEKIQINEVDGPSYDPKEDPFCETHQGSLPMSHEMLDRLMDNPSQAFGHGYSLAGALLDWSPSESKEDDEGKEDDDEDGGGP